MKSFLPFHFVRPLCGFLVLAIPGRAQPSPDAATAIPLATLVAEISVNNPELKFYEAEISAAKAGVRSAGALSDPELSFDLGRKRVKDSSGATLGDGAAWSVSVTQTFEWPGRISLRKAIANRDVALAELGASRFQQALAARASTLAYGLYAANAKSAAVREVADRFAALKEAFLARDAAGVAPLLETRVIEASELTLQRRASEAELALQASLIELNQLRGAPAGSPLKVASTALTLNEPPSREALIAAAMEKNFEFKMRQVELEQQGYAVRLSRNERYPAISVSPFYSQEKAGDKEAVVGVGLSVPLPITGRARSATDVAQARHRQAEVTLLVAQRELEREVLIAAQAFSTKLAETRRWSPDSIQKFREAAELADRHYRLGSVPIATYVEMQNAYLEAVEALLDTQREAMEAGLRVQLLTGLDFNAVQISQP